MPLCQEKEAAVEHDEELYRRFLAGEQAAYDELMIRYGDSLTVYLNGYIHNWHDAEDLMIEAFARIMVKRPKIRDGGFKAYLYKTARNLTSRFSANNKRATVFGLDEISEDISSEERTEEGFLDGEKKAALHFCLGKIDPLLKEALWLVYCEDLSYDQAAAVMGENRKRIDHLLTRGKEQMRKELAKEGIINAY